MANIQTGLCWAAALIVLAAGNAAGIVDDKTASTLFTILPTFAIIALGRGRGCAPATRA